MNINDEVDLLRRVPLFQNVEPAKLKLLAFMSERLNFQAGQHLFTQGETGDAAFVIMEGEADVVVDSAEGPITVATLGQDALLGEISILCDVPRTATVVAKTKLSTLKIGKEKFFHLLREFPEVAIEMTRVLAERLHVTTADLTQARAELQARSGGGG